METEFSLIFQNPAHHSSDECYLSQFIILSLTTYPMTNFEPET